MKCKYGKYYCSTDKMWKCRKGPKQTRESAIVEKEAYDDYDAGGPRRSDDKARDWKKHLIFRYGIKNRDLSLSQIENLIRKKYPKRYKRMLKDKERFYSGDVKLKTETKEAPKGTYFTKTGNLVKGKLTKAAKERGARETDPKDKIRSKVPPVTQGNESAISQGINQITEMKTTDYVDEKQFGKHVQELGGSRALAVIMTYDLHFFQKMAEKHFYEIEKEKGGESVWQWRKDPKGYTQHPKMVRLRNFVQDKLQQALDGSNIPIQIIHFDQDDEMRPLFRLNLNTNEGTRCWKGYKKKGMKTMFGKRVPNCVKNEDKDNVTQVNFDLDKTIKVNPTEPQKAYDAFIGDYLPFNFSNGMELNLMDEDYDPNYTVWVLNDVNGKQIDMGEKVDDLVSTLQSMTHIPIEQDVANFDEGEVVDMDSYRKKRLLKYKFSNERYKELIDLYFNAPSKELQKKYKQMADEYRQLGVEQGKLPPLSEGPITNVIKTGILGMLLSFAGGVKADPKDVMGTALTALQNIQNTPEGRRKIINRELIKSAQASIGNYRGYFVYVYLDREEKQVHDEIVKLGIKKPFANIIMMSLIKAEMGGNYMEHPALGYGERR